MSKTSRPGRVNLKAALICLSVVGLLCAGGAVGYKVRKRISANRALAAGQAAFERRDWAEASKYLRAYLLKYPDTPEILRQYAEANLAVRPIRPVNLDAAMSAYRRYLRHKPGEPRASDELARLYFLTANYLDCTYVARQRLLAEPSDPRATKWLARGLIAQRKNDEALEVLTGGLEQHPDQIDYYSMLSQMALQSDVPSAREDGRRWLDRAVERNPQSADALALRGRFLLHVIKDVPAARFDLERADELAPQDPTVRLMLAENWLDQGELDRAEAELRAVEGLNPEALASFEVNAGELAFIKLKAAAILALRREAGQEGVAVAERGLQELAADQRTMFLPFAAELYLADNRVVDARKCVEEYGRAVEELARQDQAIGERLALLRATLALAENAPYTAINLLEDMAIRQPLYPQVWRLLGEAYRQTGQARRAVDALAAYLGRRPDDRRVRMQLVKQCCDNGEFAKALHYLGPAPREGSEDAGARLLRVQATLQGGGGKLTPVEASEVAKQLAEIRQAEPGSLQARLLAAALAQVQGRMNEAIGELEATVGDHAGALAARMALAEVCVRAGQQDKAAGVCRAAIEKHPAEAAPRLLLARLQASAGRDEDARRTFREAVANLVGEQRSTAALALAQHLFSRKAAPEAIALLRQVATEQKEDAQVRLALLQVPAVQADAGESQRLIDELKGIEGEGGLRWRFEQAKLWLRSDKWKERQEDIAELLKRCAAVDPGWPLPVIVLGQMYERLGRDDRAEEAYRRSFDADPGNILVASRLLELLERQRRFTESSRVLERAPGGLAALSGHEVKVAIGRADYELAIHELEERLAANPGDVASHVLLARLLHFHRKDLNGALQHLDAAAAITPNLPSILSSRVAILHAEGQDAEAEELLSAEVSRRQDFGCYLLRAEYYTLVGKFDLAEKDYQHLQSFPDSASEYHAALGRFYERTGRSKEAITTWQAGLQADPENLGLQVPLMRALVGSTSAEERASGEKMLDGLLKRLPDDAGLLAIQARVLLRRGRPEAAEQAFRVLERVVQLNPGDLVAHRILIDAARARGEITRASQMAARALGANPGNIDLLLVRAELEHELNNVLSARELTQSVLKIDSRNMGARNLQVRMAIRAGDMASAETLNQDALQVDPMSEEAQIARAEILNLKGQREEAIRDLEAYRKAEKSPYTNLTLLALVDLHRIQGDFKNAEERLNQAELAEPGSIAVLLVRLKLWASQGRFEDIIGGVAEHSRKNPQDSQTLLSVASILTSAGAKDHLRKLKPLLEQFISANPDRADGYLGAAMVTHAAGEAEEAEKAYRKLLEVMPYHQQALNNLAWILGEELHRPEEAIEFARRGVERYPDDPHLLNTRGVLLFRLDMLTEARSDLEKCAQMVTGLPATHARTLLYLGRVYLKQGETSLARQTLTRSLEVDRRYKVLTDGERTELQSLVNGSS